MKQIPYLMIKSTTTIHKEEKNLRKKQRKQSKFVDIVERKHHMQVATKPEMPSAIFVAKRDILKKFARALMSR